MDDSNVEEGVLAEPDDMVVVIELVVLVAVEEDVAVVVACDGKTELEDATCDVALEAAVMAQ